MECFAKRGWVVDSCWWQFADFRTETYADHACF